MREAEEVGIVGAPTVVRFVLAVVLAGVLGACAGAEPEDAGVRSDPFHEVEVTTDPDRMVVRPDRASAGERVEVAFPAGDARLPVFAIEREQGEGWHWGWLVHSEPGADPIQWTAEEFRRRDIQINAGPVFDGADGPHEIPVPAGATPGRYRICQVGEADPLCAEFDVG